MDSHLIDRSAFDAFIRECKARRATAARLLADLESGSADAAAGDIAASIKSITLHLHDVIGEARFLGFDDVSHAAGQLTELLDRSRGAMESTTFRSRLGDWLDQLYRAATMFAESVGDSGQVELIAQLLEELSRAQGPQEQKPLADEAPSERRILVFDDSSVVRYLLESHLEAEGYSAVTAENIDEFNQRLESGFEPDMLLLDINMPGMPGDEVCRQLRKRPDTRHLKIILMSSLSDEELAELARRAGADGYLSKKHGMEELAAYLDRALESLDFSRKPPAKSTDEDALDGAFNSGSSIAEALAAAAAAAVASTNND